MAKYGPLFDTTPSPTTTKKVHQGPGSTIVLAGRPAKINWMKKFMGEHYHAGVSFDSKEASIWVIRKHPDGELEPIRCALYGMTLKEMEAEKDASPSERRY